MTRHARNGTNRRTRNALLAATGLALAIGSIPAGAAVGPSLGAARTFAALGGSTLTNTGATTTIVGDVGVSPGSAVTGITQSQVTGGIYVGGDAEADQAHSDAALAYNFLAGMASDVNLTSTDLGGLTLSPGVYTFNSSAALTGAMFLDAGGDSGAVFVFQVGTSFTTAPGSSVTVINGGADYDESNIYWQVGSSATLGTTTAFLGVIVADQSVTLETGASLTGLALAINGAASLDSNQVTAPPVVVPVVVTLPPIDLTAVVGGPPDAPSGDLEWTDASDNETEFRVYRRDGVGPAFVLIATIPATDMPGTGGMTTYQDPGLEFDTIYTYRVTAFGAAAGESAPSNEALLDTGAVVPAVLAPIDLTAVLTGTLAVPGADLDWTDASDDETEFRVYRRDGASPDFLQIGTVPSSDTPGAGGAVSFQDPALDPSGTYTYRVTAFSPSDGESAPSNEVLLDTAEGPPVRWLDVDLGRKHSVISDRKASFRDALRVRGSYTMLDVETGVPTVMDDVDPRATAVSVQVMAPGSLVLLTIPANDPKWKARRRGIYTWRTRDGRRGPHMSVRFDANRSEFTFRASRNQFAAVPVNAVTVSLSMGGATGTDVRDWKRSGARTEAHNALFTISR